MVALWPPHSCPHTFVHMTYVHTHTEKEKTKRYPVDIMSMGSLGRQKKVEWCVYNKLQGAAKPHGPLAYWDTPQLTTLTRPANHNLWSGANLSNAICKLYFEGYAWIFWILFSKDG